MVRFRGRELFLRTVRSFAGQGATEPGGGVRRTSEDAAGSSALYLFKPDTKAGVAQPNVKSGSC